MAACPPSEMAYMLDTVADEVGYRFKLPEEEFASRFVPAFTELVSQFYEVNPDFDAGDGDYHPSNQSDSDTVTLSEEGDSMELEQD